MKFAAPLAAAILAGCALPASAAVVTLDFEDRPGSDVLIQDGYGGVNWGGKFLTYDQAGDGVFTPTSGKGAAYFNYVNGGMTAGKKYTQSMTFDDPVLFLGAWFSGDAVYGAQFEFYLDGVYLGSTFTNVGKTPAFLSGIGKAVDEVRLTGGAGNFIMDDFSYDTELPVAAVPEPATWAMLIMGFGAMGALLRRRHGFAAA